jgi:dihydroxy-acid dehydratase
MRRGLPGHAFDGRPHIAIANTASDLTPCNAHLNEVAESVKQGVYEAGGIPMNLPVVSLGETNVRPTAMLWRNMAAMAAEEMLRANPIDGVVLLGGCDKTIPALLMAAASVDLPAVVLPGGPMLSGTFRGRALGCGTDVWKLSEEVRAGTLSQQDFLRSESSMIRSRGHCNTMGTASTMALMAEALGTTMPGVAGTPAADSRLLQAAHETGRMVISMVRDQRRPSELLSRGSFLNAIVALAAVGGSTNAVIHLLAIAGRLGITLTQDDFDRVGASVPLLVDLQPSGRFLMEDFHRAGGLLAVLREVEDLLDPTALTVTGRPLVEYLADQAAVRSAAAARRDRRPVRKPGPYRGRDQARGGIRAAAAPSRPDRRVRLDRGLPRPYRRSGAGRRRGLDTGASRLRAQGISGDARGGEHAAAEEASGAGRSRHGPHLRRADERNRVRNRRSFTFRPRLPPGDHWG